MKLKLPTLSRRDFLAKSTIGAGLVLAAPSILRAKEAGAPTDDIRVGFIGCGKQHEVLFNAMVNIPGIRYVAACDIMKARVGRTASAIKSRFDYMPNRYLDAAEMLEKEELDAVFVATPDFWHAPHTIMALEAGCDVYCEKMMSNTLEGARSMVAAMDRTGKLCQIGHQRRSNPRYLYTLNELINKEKICGQIINVNGQWNRALSSSQDIVSKPSILPDAEILRKYEFNLGADHELTLDELRHRFLNWRFYTSLSGGPISDLGAHQIDIFNWYLGATPKSVMASGGRSYFKDREHYDNVMCIFDYDTPQGNARAFYQVLTTTSSGGGYYESFMGTEGTIDISEREAYTKIFKESGADNAKWDNLVRRGLLKKQAAGKAAGGASAIAAYESAPPDEYALPGGLSKAPHQPHIENFLETIRGNATLTCDARHALESEAPIYWVNEAANTQEIIHFTDEHLHT
ncbi:MULTISPECIES: Gfo/Idh/MocA family protein [unclassified Lentimonas]|uniref:Gfo/Idh/MocA family oxidoreductase n=1 Tax=unclassified Lentimonas TaxID=2630993 RepID=UPI001328C206|nr:MULTISPECIES: Gfo/Idh/MocA family oxidoreductase [unclassified Lentimonas]CAA6678555.1 Myo-inositol 2-dehydrogenase 1 (EC [Lentimonas sp. CC4]CAA6685787.1 Myo-inositol 2-dehydrogenase 1 (EC [Lentimonas sp. CC6]CAA7076261.1 Myo-inositol 2-dehydrogenase 1 (EC [Lentimonas sp. CC4]CAA7171927.1 Myo-inositol 2-dehydrogenase 1 (EC [Lentimonas sp. CC21]CAA7181515.1 Myo-inositol 2-dehydrogenase 1 (EC [Lentimonas sp. CC8]